MTRWDFEDWFAIVRIIVFAALAWYLYPYTQNWGH